MLKGIKFVLKSGQFDYYDPVEYDDGLQETETKYLVDNGFYKYEIMKSDIESYSWYDLCLKCQRGLDEDGNCHYCDDESEAQP